MSYISVSSKLLKTFWKKPKYNSFRNKCFTFDMYIGISYKVYIYIYIKYYILYIKYYILLQL